MKVQQMFFIDTVTNLPLASCRFERSGSFVRVSIPRKKLKIKSDFQYKLSFLSQVFMDFVNLLIFFKKKTRYSSGLNIS